MTKYFQRWANTEHGKQVLHENMPNSPKASKKRRAKRKSQRKAKRTR